MAHLSGKTGGVYSGAEVLNTCEANWDSEDGDVTVARSTTKKVGTYSQKLVCAAGLSTNTICATDAIGATDVTDRDVFHCWIQSNVNMSAGDWQVCIDESVNCGGADKRLDLPPLTADTWQRCILDGGDMSAMNAVICVGLRQVVDKGACNV